jgi:Zn ribbon nucleic-acid-binding protein
MFGLQGEVSSVDKISLWEELSMEPVSCGAKGTRSANHINTSILSLIIQCMIASSK